MLGRKELLKRIDALIEDTQREAEDDYAHLPFDSSSIISEQHPHPQPPSHINLDRPFSDLYTDVDDDHDSDDLDFTSSNSQGIAKANPVLHKEGRQASCLAALQVFVHCFLPIDLSSLLANSAEVVAGCECRMYLGFRFLDYDTVLIRCRDIESSGRLSIEAGKSCLFRSLDMALVQRMAASAPMYVMLLEGVGGRGDSGTCRLLSSTAIDISDVLRSHDQWHAGTYDCFDLMGRVNGSVRLRIRFMNYGDSLAPHIFHSSTRASVKALQDAHPSLTPTPTDQQEQPSYPLMPEACGGVSQADAYVISSSSGNPATVPQEEHEACDGSFSWEQPNKSWKKHSVPVVRKVSLAQPPPLYYKNVAVEEQNSKDVKSTTVPHRQARPSFSRPRVVKDVARLKVKKTRTQLIRENTVRKRMEKKDTVRPCGRSSRKLRSTKKKPKPKPKAIQENERSEERATFFRVFESLEEANSRYNLS